MLVIWLGILAYFRCAEFAFFRGLISRLQSARQAQSITGTLLKWFVAPFCLFPAGTSHHRKFFFPPEFEVKSKLQTAELRSRVLLCSAAAAMTAVCYHLQRLNQKCEVYVEHLWFRGQSLYSLKPLRTEELYSINPRIGILLRVEEWDQLSDCTLRTNSMFLGYPPLMFLLSDTRRILGLISYSHV